MSGTCELTAPVLRRYAAGAHEFTVPGDGAVAVHHQVPLQG